MTIQFNTDHNIDGDEAFRKTFIDMIESELDRFSSHITRIEAHLTDKDGNTKNGQKDIRCMLEARLENRQPIAVTNDGNTPYLAVEGAIDKLKTTIDTILGKLKNH